MIHTVRPAHSPEQLSSISKAVQALDGNSWQLRLRHIAATPGGGGDPVAPSPCMVAARHCISALPEPAVGVEARPDDHVPRHTSVAL